jgi:histidyl-tRNA synthetase
VENSRLVRGLDYYSHTVFEWTTEHLGSQSAVCAGGRYDGLLEQLGARNMPGVGWAFGMERVVALLDALNKSPAAKGPDIFVMATNDVPFDKSIALAEWLRELFPERSIMHNVGAGSLKSQFRKADKSGAVVAVVAGSEELQQDTLTLKPLLSGADQIKVARADVQAELSALLGSC